MESPIETPRRLPSLTALRVFEAVARRASFTRAAGELGVTQAAASRQVKRLEEELGTLLFERRHRAIALTRAGESLYDAVRRGFDEIGAAAAALRQSPAGASLTISVSPYFSSAWLTPRLPGFRRRYPGVELLLHHSYEPPDYRREAFDLGINWGNGKWPGVVAERVLTGALVALVCPALAGGGPLDPGALLDLTLLYEFTPEHWRAWFAQRGIALPSSARMQRIDDSHALRQAALDGQGVALFFWGLAQRDITAGRLVEACAGRLEHGADYYLTYPRHAIRRVELQRFRRWLVGEIRANPYA